MLIISSQTVYIPTVRTWNKQAGKQQRRQNCDEAAAEAEMRTWVWLLSSWMSPGSRLASSRSASLAASWLNSFMASSCAGVRRGTSRCRWLRKK